MGKRARDDTLLATLVKMAIPLVQEAERQCPRTGPGDKPKIPDWLMAALIMIGVLAKKKTVTGYLFAAVCGDGKGGSCPVFRYVAIASVIV